MGFEDLPMALTCQNPTIHMLEQVKGFLLNELPVLPALGSQQLHGLESKKKHIEIRSEFYYEVRVKISTRTNGFAFCYLTQTVCLALMDDTDAEPFSESSLFPKNY